MFLRTYSKSIWAGRRFLSLFLVLCFVGSLIVPSPVMADNVARTLGGAAGLAAGSMAGAALSSAVIGAAGIASMPAVVPLVITTSIVGASAWTGAKVFSKLGLKLDEVAGPKATWTMLGATLGTVAALALIPATGIFLGPAGLVLKALIGGVAGGSIAALFSDQLESVATPRNIYAAAGGTVGALIGGVPGAVAGGVGGYAIGGILDDNFFADEGYDDCDDDCDGCDSCDGYDDYDNHDNDNWCSPYDKEQRSGRQRQRRFVDCKNDIEDWHYNRIDRFKERWIHRREQYAEVEDCYYWENSFYDNNPNRWDKSYRYNNRDDYTAYDDTDAEIEENGDGLNTSERLLRAKARWVEAVAKFEEASIDPNRNRREVAHYLKQVNVTKRRYEKVIQESRGY